MSTPPLPPPQERKAEEAARKRAELKKLQAEEEAAMAAAAKKKAAKPAAPKVRAPLPGGSRAKRACGRDLVGVSAGSLAPRCPIRVAAPRGPRAPACFPAGPAAPSDIMHLAAHHNHAAQLLQPMAFAR